MRKKTNPITATNKNTKQRDKNTTIYALRQFLFYIEIESFGLIEEFIRIYVDTCLRQILIIMCES